MNSHQTSLYLSLNQFAEAIQDEKTSEEALLSGLDCLFEQNKEAWKTTYFPSHKMAKWNYRGNLLYLAITTNRAKLALALIKHEIPIDKIILDIMTDRSSALAETIIQSDIFAPVVQTLLDKIPPASLQDGAILKDLFISITSVAIAQTVVSHCEKKHIPLINSEIFRLALLNADKKAALQTILSQTTPLELTQEEIQEVIKTLRNCRYNIENAAILKNAQDFLLMHYLKPLTLADARPVKFEESYKQLFYNHNSPPVNNEHDAKKNIMAQIYALLTNPEACIKYLRFLNEEYARYCKEATGENPPVLPPDSYTLERVEGRLLFPVPSKNYKGIAKHGVLQRFLLARFSQFYGLSNSVYKLIGYIEGEAAEKIWKNGSFAVEEKLGSGGSFHGKLSHMFQQAIILLAIEAKAINLTFTSTIRLTPQDVLASFADDSSWWDGVREPLPEKEGILSFTSPFALHSFILSHGAVDDLGFRELSDSLIDSFIKTLQAQLALQQKTDPTAKNLTLKEFFEKFSGLRQSTIGFYQLDKNVYAAASKKESEKKSELVMKGGCGHRQWAIYKINNRYKLCENFKHRSIEAEAKKADSPSQHTVSLP